MLRLEDAEHITPNTHLWRGVPGFEGLDPDVSPDAEDRSNEFVDAAVLKLLGYDNNDMIYEMFYRDYNPKYGYPLHREDPGPLWCLSPHVEALLQSAEEAVYSADQFVGTFTVALQGERVIYVQDVEKASDGLDLELAQRVELGPGDVIWMGRGERAKSKSRKGNLLREVRVFTTDMHGVASDDLTVPNRVAVVRPIINPFTDETVRGLKEAEA